MPNYDMSTTACRERAQQEQRIDTLEHQVRMLFALLRKHLAEHKENDHA